MSPEKQNTVQTISSKDGTVIAFDRLGDGPPLVIVGGTLGDRTQQAPLAALLAKHFTVHNYDRRAHGQSGDRPPYTPEHEFEDLEAIIDATGGSAFVYGTSGCAVLALHAAASGLGPKMKKLALWEPAYQFGGSLVQPGDNRPQAYKQQLSELGAAGRHGDMVELFMTEAVGLPAQFVAPMRHSPWWPAQEALAPTLLYDAELMGDFAIAPERIGSVTVPTLVMDGATTPSLSQAAQAVAEALPNAERRTLEGQQHNVDPATIAPVLSAFFDHAQGA